MVTTSSMKGFVTALILCAVGLIFWIYLTPTVVDAIQTMNTTSWSFVGKDGAIALVQLLPFIWVAAGVVVFLGVLFGKITFGE